MNGPNEQQAAALEALQHAVQTGVKTLMENAAVRNTRLPQTEPKFLRVGVNSALIDSAALARLLVEKGVISPTDYWDALVRGWQEEVERYTAEVSEALGRPVRLL